MGGQDVGPDRRYEDERQEHPHRACPCRRDRGRLFLCRAGRTRADGRHGNGYGRRQEILAIARERAAQAGGGGFGGPGGGEGRGGEFMAQMFDRADANKDGKLSGEEIPPFMRERLESIDTNKDGSLDKAELEAGMGRMREGRGGRGEGRGEGQGRGEGGRRRPDAEGEGEGDAPKKE